MPNPSQNFDILLLAAGMSRRMGSDNKLLMPFGKKRLIRHVAERVLGMGVGRLTVVTGHESRDVSQEISDLPLTICHNPDFEAGQMSSVRAGSRGIAADSKGMMVALSDMPFLTSKDYLFLYESFLEQESSRILVPFFGEERGNPIIVPPDLISVIAEGGLNAGCKKLVRDHPDKVKKIEAPSTAFVSDLDTRLDYSLALDRTLISKGLCC
ncbi:MAG: nucleotidyltransferase family protein [Proteobacteria bacterium]|nr:nucleotidyltransferase family protein [Pseudomonadota bacterium]